MSSMLEVYGWAPAFSDDVADPRGRRERLSPCGVLPPFAVPYGSAPRVSPARPPPVAEARPNALLRARRRKMGAFMDQDRNFRELLLADVALARGLADAAQVASALQRYWEEQAPVADIGYTPGEEDVRAVIRLGPAARWVADYYPVETVSDDKEGLTVRFSARDASVIARLLLRLGSEAELVEGDQVGTRLDELRSRILRRYR